MRTTVSRRAIIGASPALLAGVALGALPRSGVAQAPPGRMASPAAIRLAGNENPYGPGPAARAAIEAGIGDSWKYPIIEEMAFKARLAGREGLSPQQVLLGDGSSEILHIAALLAGTDGGEVITATPTFSFVAEHVRAIGGRVRQVPLDAGMRHDLKAMRAAVSPATRLVYVCNPNNPTGTLVSGAELHEFLATLPSGVTALVDEAYLELAADMAAESVVDRVRAGDNLIVARTFSKLHGLAGLRIGYALARPDLIERMTRLKLVAVNSLGLAAAAASHDDLHFQSLSRNKNAAGVAITTAVLDELKRPYAQTRANFVFFDTGQPAAAFLAAMRERGFALGRPFPQYPNWCRVSMGTVEQMRLFADALRAG
ncbi:MAG: aminotransferase class I/II-fold pyridoxal phosphate-dependent enzyme, partial [Gammaproteobacteria bacterium]|nr:aminotransferase class I/II-fold pyridoxal phosphate-dependent enzyme [Gammaproteobacteria bacterium]